jgi:hypothetical protein
MKSSSKSHSNGHPVIITSVLALLTWFGVLAFLATWFQAWAVGRLQPADSTSSATLIALFLLAFLASVRGVYLSVRGWRGKSLLKWQVTSLITALLTLWAVSGD